MTVFAAGLDALFGDPNMAEAAVYRAGGVGGGDAVRVILSRPDRVQSWSETRFVTDSVSIEVRVSDAPALAEGDTFEVDGVTYTVRGEPVRDLERLTWEAEAVAS